MSDRLVMFLLKSELARKILKILKTLQHDPPYTRQLLRMINDFTYGHKVINELERLGLIKSLRMRCKHNQDLQCRYLVITGLGEEVLEATERLLEEVSRVTVERNAAKPVEYVEVAAEDGFKYKMRKETEEYVQLIAKAYPSR